MPGRSDGYRLQFYRRAFDRANSARELKRLPSRPKNDTPQPIGVRDAHVFLNEFGGNVRKQR
jgi:hypothetical protein